MNLQELLAANSSAKIEYDAALEKKFQAGHDKCAAETEARIVKARVVLDSDVYPAPYQKMAIKVVTGETEAAALEGAIAHYDAMKENEKSKVATKETEALPDSPPNGVATQSADGMISTEADLAVAIAQSRNNLGKVG